MSIVDLSRGGPPADRVVQICVIGSGCGGATAARVLAEAGLEVLVLEEGGDFTGSALTQREGAMYDQLYMDRGGRMTEDLSVSVLQGRVLGGGGVINACDVVPIPDPVKEHWVRAHGLSDFSPSALAPFEAAALADLTATRVPEGQVVGSNKVLREGAAALGWRGEIMMHNRVGCEELGTCLIGCPIDAKRNPRFVAIPKAIAAGAQFLTRARAVGIAGAGHDVKTVHVRRLDPRGYHEQEGFRIRAQVVIVAANAVNSAQLLLRSGIGNRWMGRALSLQPQLPVMGLFDAPQEAFRGIPQSYAVTEFERVDATRGLGGYRIEGIFGTPGMSASLLPQTGPAGKALMTRYRHMAGVLCLVPDAPQGVVKVRGDGRLRIQYAPTEALHRTLRAAARSAARAFLAAGARQAFVPVNGGVAIDRLADLGRLDDLVFRAADPLLVSAHQQGAVRMAPSPALGAADPTGQVYGTRQVYVFDSGGFPTTSSTHTMTPIITVARALATRLAQRLGRA